MSEAVVDDIVAILPPLLQSLEALGFIARYLNPPDFDRVMETAGQPDAALRAVRPRLAQWPAQFADIKTPLETASDAALAAFEGLRVVQNGHGDFVSLFRALRYAPRAQEALYALSAKLPPVNQFFVDPALRGDAELEARLAAPANPNTGVFHNQNEPGSRGGFSFYVPEYYTPDRAWPLVMALHGGRGNGRGFLWSWLRGLPVHIVQGRLDWMLPVQVARQTSQALSAAGANVSYRELDDLSHTYPREMNAEILQWLNAP